MGVTGTVKIRGTVSKRSFMGTLSGLVRGVKVSSLGVDSFKVAGRCLGDYPRHAHGIVNNSVSTSPTRLSSVSVLRVCLRSCGWAVCGS